MDLLQFSAMMGNAAISVETHMADCLERACELLEKTAKDAMGDPGNDFGWPPLKPETIARKANGDTPLVETGELRDSIQHNSDTREGYVGTNNEKAPWHEFGTDRVPPRPFLGGAVTAKGEDVVELIGGEVFNAIAGPKRP